MVTSIGQWATWTPKNRMCSSITGEVLAIDDKTIVLLPDAPDGQRPRPLHRSLDAGNLEVARATAQ